MNYKPPAHILDKLMPLSRKLNVSPMTLITQLLDNQLNKEAKEYASKTTVKPIR